MKGKLDIVRTREGDGGSAGDGAGRGERLTGRNTAPGRQGPQYSQDRGQLIVGSSPISSHATVGFLLSWWSSFSELSEDLCGQLPTLPIVITLPSRSLLLCLCLGLCCVEYTYIRDELLKLSTESSCNWFGCRRSVAATQSKHKIEDEDDARTPCLRL